MTIDVESWLPEIEGAVDWLRDLIASPEQKALLGVASATLAMLEDVKDRPSVRNWWATVRTLSAIEAAKAAPAVAAKPAPQAAQQPAAHVGGHPHGTDRGTI